LDNRIETLENQAFLPPQHQQQQHQEQQQQQLHQMSSSMSMNETLTDPSTQLTQTQQPAFHNDDDEVDYFRQESHPPASTRTSIAGALPPLDFTQVSSTRRPRISTKVEQQEEEDDKSGLTALVSPNCPFPCGKLHIHYKIPFIFNPFEKHNKMSSKQH
jgi:hypothetical protein